VAQNDQKLGQIQQRGQGNELFDNNFQQNEVIFSSFGFVRSDHLR